MRWCACALVFFCWFDFLSQPFSLLLCLLSRVFVVGSVVVVVLLFSYIFFLLIY